MSHAIPPLPNADRLREECDRVAGVERLQPESVEKDFHLTRVIWALAQELGEELLLKGGTCLSKVDLGYHRMSEDADFVIPEAASGHKGTNAKKLDKIRGQLRGLVPSLGMACAQPDGTRSEKGSHGIWEISYPGRLPNIVVLEVSLRPRIRPPRKAALRQLLDGVLAEPYSDAFCWALGPEEVRAEKVRAAFTREEPQIRDFYDLDLLRRQGLDLSSAGFVGLVDQKLAELGERPLAEQPPRFGLTDEEIVELLGPGMIRLTSVVRIDEPRFDLAGALRAFDELWGR